MILTNKQEQGLRLAVERYKNKEKYTVIAGYAGTGKSTLIRFLIDALDVDEGDVIYCAFTGKACTVLQNKGNKNVSTLHKLLWEWRPQRNGKFFRKRKEITQKIVVVDEVSMVSQELIKELLSRPNIHILFLGDPAQLPPVDKDNCHQLLEKPHIFLDEVMRQAAESEIIRLTMDIRAGKVIQPMRGNEVVVFKKNELIEGMLTWADQVICATNNMRGKLNYQMRQITGRGENPEPGDKIICTRNYWNEISMGENPLVNGTIGYLEDFSEHHITYPAFYDGLKVDILESQFRTDVGDLFNINIDKQRLITEKESYPKDLKYRIGRNQKFSDTIPYEFLYGYSITCHKSQGSEWNNVLVIEEKFPFDKEEHKKWLYTACTRASEKLVLIQN